MLKTLVIATRLTRSLILTVLFCASTYAVPRIQTIQFQSRMLNATVPYNVVLPTDYDTSNATRYPVLYLLHGLTGHYSDWLSHTNIADYASQYRIIVVMPEGNDGWYTDSLTVVTDKYESYILKELIPDVQRRFRTIEARYGRAVAGLSMGGYGSIKFGLKYPGTFVFAGSMSGAFGITRLTEKDLGSARWENSLKLFGATASDSRTANDLFDIITQLPANQVASLPYFYFDCGTEDSATIFPYNRQLAFLMSANKIPHEFRELPGDHTWGYWDRQVQEVLKMATQKVRLPPALPANTGSRQKQH